MTVSSDETRPRCECHGLRMHKHGCDRYGRQRWACPEQRRRQLERRRRPRCYCDECQGEPKAIKQTFPNGRVKYRCASKMRRRVRDWYKRTDQSHVRTDRCRRIIAEEVRRRGAGCEDCGAPFTLFAGKDGFHWHHRSPRLKTALISELVSAGVGRGRLLRELAVCRLLCDRCHQERHDTGRLAA